jgi:hypothetical protein
VIAHELRIASMHGIEVPDNLDEGALIDIVARVLVSDIHTNQVDVTTLGALEPEHLPGPTTVCAVVAGHKVQVTRP